MLKRYIQHQLQFKSDLVAWLKTLPNKVETPEKWQALIESRTTFSPEVVDTAGVRVLAQHFKEGLVTKNALIKYLSGELKYLTLSLWQEVEQQYQPELKTVPMDQSLIPQNVLEQFKGYRLQSFELPSHGYHIIKVFYNKDKSKPKWLLYDKHWKKINGFNESTAFKDGAELLDYVYTEVQSKHHHVIPSGHTTTNQYEEHSLLGGDKYQEWFVCANDWLYDFYGPHFRIKNLVFHLRTSQWDDTQGQRLFLIDELQSDWHNQYRHNEDGNTPYMPFYQDWITIALRTAISLAVRTGHKQIGFTTAEHHIERWGVETPAFKILYDKTIPKLLRRLQREYGGNISTKTIETLKPTKKLKREKEGWRLNNASSNSNAFNPMQNKQVALNVIKRTSQPAMETVRTFEMSDALIEAAREESFVVDYK